jgi:hypothetical protein
MPLLVGGRLGPTGGSDVDRATRVPGYTDVNTLAIALAHRPSIAGMGSTLAHYLRTAYSRYRGVTCTLLFKHEDEQFDGALINI